ncbi:hypothetical protein EI94DRAFT_1698709 [Lactarius quietus]|nr:hypothetical protein EI94DRAFT_1698709 [Lactarius quietus]
MTMPTLHNENPPQSPPPTNPPRVMDNTPKAHALQGLDQDVPMAPPGGNNKIMKTVPTPMAWPNEQHPSATPKQSLFAHLEEVASGQDNSDRTPACSVIDSCRRIIMTEEASITALRPSKKALQKNKTPMSFLIYNIMHEQADFMLQRKVWSSRAITLRVALLKTTCPNFLFAIKGLSAICIKDIFPILRKVWDSESTKTFVNSLIEDIDDDDEKAQISHDIDLLLSSMSLARLDIKEAGNTLCPQFNIPPWLEWTQQRLGERPTPEEEQSMCHEPQARDAPHFFPEPEPAPGRCIPSWPEEPPWNALLQHTTRYPPVPPLQGDVALNIDHVPKNQVIKANINIAMLNMNGYTALARNMTGIEKWSAIYQTMKE